MSTKSYCVKLDKNNDLETGTGGIKDDWFVSLPDVKKHSEFLGNVFQLLTKEAVFDGTSRSQPVTRWRDPKYLKQLIDFEPSEDPENEEYLLKAIKLTIAYSVKTGHPYFVNQLFSGLDPYGLAGQLVTDALNGSVYTYEVAPVFSLMESSVLQTVRALVGWEAAGDGIFCPGGSIANGIGINLARYSYDSDIKKNGVSGLPRLVIFASIDAHYSIKKMAALLGIGENNVILINTDSTGSMDTKHLQSCINKSYQNGDVPIAVIATAGTTVLGAFDPLPAIADICHVHSIWLHVDAAWGGGLLFSKTHFKKLEGIHRADSLTFNPHKLLAVPQQCSILLTRHPGALGSCHSAKASYLFQPDKFYGPELDCGDSHIQCGRRPDVFKFWLMWKAKGTKGFERHVDTIMEVSQFFKDCVKDRPNFRLVSEPQFVNVCFWFIPPSMTHFSEDDFNSSEGKAKIHKIGPIIKERMIRKGSLMLSYQPIQDKPNFFRFVTQNSALNKHDVTYILDEIENLGADL